MFNQIIVDNFCHPLYQGSLPEPTFVLSISNPVCGDKVEIDLNVNHQLVVEDARFRAWGCTTSLAMANLFCQYVKDKTTTELAALNQESINGLLGELEPAQQHCIDMLHILLEQLKEQL